MPGYRGRLIRPMFVDVAHLDTDATQTTDPDGAGPLTSGWDDDFEEPSLVPPDEVGGLPPVDSPRGPDPRVYTDPPTRLPAQIEIEDFELLRQLGSGQSPAFELGCVFHIDDLEAAGLLDVSGKPMIRLNDKLVRILDDAEDLIIEIPDPPGLFAIRTESRSFGLMGGTRNLVLVIFQDRMQGVRSV